MAIKAALGAALLSATGGQASAQDDEGQTFTTNIWSEPENCSAATASPVELWDLAENGEKWKGECVSVAGYWSHYALYRDREDALRDRDNVDAEIRDRRVGLYGKQVIHAADVGRSRFYTAIGIAGLCAELRNDFNIIQGYCVYGEGAYLATSAILGEEDATLPARGGSIASGPVPTLDEKGPPGEPDGPE